MPLCDGVAACPGTAGREGWEPCSGEGWGRAFPKLRGLLGETVLTAPWHSAFHFPGVLHHHDGSWYFQIRCRGQCWQQGPWLGVSRPVLGCPWVSLAVPGCPFAALVGRVPEGGEPWGWAATGTQPCCPCTTSTTHEAWQPTLGTGSSDDSYHLLTPSAGLFPQIPDITVQAAAHRGFAKGDNPYLLPGAPPGPGGADTAVFGFFQETGAAKQRGCDGPGAAPVPPAHRPADHEGEIPGFGTS